MRRGHVGLLVYKRGSASTSLTCSSTLQVTFCCWMHQKQMVWALRSQEWGALLSPASGSGRKCVFWALINLLSKNADCWTCLNSGIKYRYGEGREQRSKALLKFSAGLFSCISSAQSILCFPSVGWGQSLWPSFQTQSTFCTYYKGCNYNLWSPLKCTHTSWWGWLFCVLGASC